MWARGNEGLNTVTVFSFSGIDGAGKSTQIAQLCEHLDHMGLRAKVLTFWDDVVAFSRLRESLSLSVFKGDKGVGSPDRPIVRRDKNVTSGPVVAFRLLLYSLDAFHLWIVRRRAADSDAPEVVIFDRYIYDELANLPLENPFIGFYVRCLLKLSPKPDLAFLVDADPEAACARKPEYPLEFVRRNRGAYLKIAQIAGMTVLQPCSITEGGARLRDLASRVLSKKSEKPAVVPFECAASPKSANCTTD